MKFNPMLHNYLKPNLGTIYFGEEKYLIIAIYEYPDERKILKLRNIEDGEEIEMVYKPFTF